MKTVKIVTLPIRFILFLIIALISGAVLLVDQTVCLVFAIAAHIVRVIGILLMLPCAVISIFMLVTDSEKLTEIAEDSSVIEWVFLVALLWLAVLFFAFLPKISEKLYIWLYIVGMWLWNFSKSILFFRRYRKVEQEEIEVLEEDAVFVDKETIIMRYSLSELRELSKELNQFNQSSNNSVIAVNSDVQEKTKEIEIEDIENW